MSTKNTVAPKKAKPKYYIIERLDGSTIVHEMTSKLGAEEKLVDLFRDYGNDIEDLSCFEFASDTESFFQGEVLLIKGEAIGFQIFNVDVKVDK